ncbi:hypothetical protein DS031_03080 [Bacillus taeanensis]|uniref:Uncharacterized protein n=2 Tax=Bacillus taeanensis TaxID=273032 RepID=A0A366XZY9_9BACI|nr:hypothetical protein DS031_03080 [Bacillus taeanensis]
MNLKTSDPSIMGSYSPHDVTFLLKDLSRIMEEDKLETREKAIQSGRHYSEMLPIEYKPSEQYLNLFYQSLNEYKKRVAHAVGVVAEQLLQVRGNNFTLVSLARAGTPIGILIKRYLAYKYNLNLPHYSISIIRGRGIDQNAIQYIMSQHPNQPIQFIDGWTGKGAISKELSKACQELQQYKELIDDRLAVLADPGHCAPIYGTRDDFLIPSACLNSTVSGLVSRTVLNDEYIEKTDFHGAKFYKELKEEDVSNHYIDAVTAEFENVVKEVEEDTKELETSYQNPTWAGLREVEEIQKYYSITDINHIKPGVGETTRVLLRRVPWKILVKNKENPDLKHILYLASERQVPIEEYTEMSYSCCGLIKTVKGN